MKTSFPFIFCLLFSLLGQAQNDSTSTIPVQFSIFPPLSTNGIENANSTNLFSINLFAGYAGGLDGFEAGGFANVIKKNMRGIQLSGFANVVGGQAQGSMFSGFVNVVGKEFTGLQLAGFSNVVSDSVLAAQFSGFCNVNAKSGKGMQSAGFLNLSNGNYTGYQSAGFCNIINGDSKGMQIAGFANVTSGNLKGMQISGFINVARELQGLQLGFINYCDSVQGGTPFGFLSIVKHGYHKMEIYSNETFYAGAQFKTGTNLFYNIFSISTRPERDNFYWAYGYGFGTEFKLSNRSRLNLDFTAHHVSEGQKWANYLNLLNKLNLNYAYEFAPHFTLFGGPNLNVLLVNKYANQDFSNDQTIAPSFNFYDEMHQNTRVIIYPGFHAGLRF